MNRADLAEFSECFTVDEFCNPNYLLDIIEEK